MPIKINEGSACLEIDGQVIATARVRPDGWREVSCWPRFVDRSQAVTALTITELLASGQNSDDPLVIPLRREL